MRLCFPDRPAKVKASLIPVNRGLGSSAPAGSALHVLEKAPVSVNAPLASLVAITIQHAMLPFRSVTGKSFAIRSSFTLISSKYSFPIRRSSCNGVVSEQVATQWAYSIRPQLSPVPCRKDIVTCNRTLAHFPASCVHNCFSQPYFTRALTNSASLTIPATLKE